MGTINGYTTDYSSLGSYFLKHNIDANGLVESNEVCYIVNNNLFCLKGGSANYYEENKNTLLASFDSIYCYSSGNGFGCSIAAFNPFISLNGEVYVSSGALSCSISSSGLAKCAHVGPA